MATILYVEDNEDNMYIGHRRLSQAGFDVLIARNGQQGIAMATESHPDLIVMDLNLPVLDGWEATRRLKASAETRSIPIVALSAHNDPKHRELAFAAGVDDFEDKPVDFASLLRKIKALLDKREA